MKKTELLKLIDAYPARSAWAKGVKNYAYGLIEELEQDEYYHNPADRKALLNGAKDWNQYSWGGCAFCYDSDIAAALSTPSELKRTNGGNRKPNAREEWLDTQARALYQAETLIGRIYRAAAR